MKEHHPNPKHGSCEPVALGDRDTTSGPQSAIDDSNPLNVVISVVAEAWVEYLHDQLHLRGYPDVTAAHGRSVLAWVDENGARPGEIARASRLTRAAVAERLAEITRMGYIQTVPIPNDKRGKLVVLTEEGLRMRAAYLQCQAELNERIQDLLGQERFADFRAMLSEIADALAPGWRKDRLGIITPQVDADDT